MLLNEANEDSHEVRPSGLPLACDRPDGTGRPWAHASGFAPRQPRADNARRGGDRPSSTDLEYRSTHIRRSPIQWFTRCVRPRVARRQRSRAPGAAARANAIVASVRASAVGAVQACEGEMACGVPRVTVPVARRRATRRCGCARPSRRRRGDHLADAALGADGEERHDVLPHPGSADLACGTVGVLG
jgi:hypothetical protein